MPFWKWSKTADTNQTSDPTINWLEGQLPSTVNNSARAMMSRLAEWRDDISGALTTAGSATAYTLTTNQVYDSLVNMNRAMVCFVPHVTNTGSAPTLNVDGLGGRPLRWAPSVDVQSNWLVAGTPYCATYFNATSEWILSGAGSSPVGVPLGVGMEFWGTTPPSSAFAFPVGQALSRTAYSSLYSLFGTTYGPGDGSTTFNLPNKLGKLTAALDSMGGSASAGLLNTIASTTLGATGGLQTTTMVQANLPAVNFTGGTGSVAVSGTTGNQNVLHSHTGSGTTSGQSADHTHQTRSVGDNSVGVNAGGVPVANSNIYQPQSGGTSNDHTHNYSFTTSTESVFHQHPFSATGSASNVTVGSGGSNSPMNNLPPVILCNYILRII